MKHTSKPDKSIAQNPQEKRLLGLYRELESIHERKAVLIIMASIAEGRLSKGADKLSVRAILGVF